ncbi:monocarboxylate transporter 12-like [Patiria miniata]|uniref:Major facilitator superfamily (MFS) profile domain-containing protein n=1 Tax=Patiria miniata TaxID=46514 RepID=A0A913ZZ58_PATMI|nr:monocarboxylate transporter 12-like [Patiria miniata]
MASADSQREFDSIGCALVLLSFTVNLLYGCVLKSLGVLLPTLTDQFTTNTWIIGIVTSLIAVASDITGLFTAPLENLFGSRRVVVVSTLMMCLGLLVVPFATSVLQLAASLVLLVGTSIGILNVLSKALLAKHFRRHLTVACGMGNIGQAMALLVFAPMMQLFLDTYGWRGATLLMAGVCFHAVPFAVLVRDADHKPNYQPLPSRNEHHEADSPGKNCPLSAFCLRLYKATNLRILLEFNFVIMFMLRFALNITFNTWMVYFVPHLVAKGFSPQVAAALCSPAAVGYLFGTVIWAPFIDRGLVKCTSGIIVSSLALAISFLVDPWVNSVLGMAVISFLLCLFLSALYTLNDVFTKELYEAERLTSAFGWIRAFGFLPRLIAGFFPGWIYETRGSYDVAFVVFGFSPVVSPLPMVFGQLWKSHKERI